MLDKLFPNQINNDYTGNIIAKYMFMAIAIVTIVRSCIHMFFADGGAQSIATIPLNTFTQNGAATVILLFGLWGSSQMLLALIYLITLWRYQKFIPFLYLLMIIEYSARIIFALVKPIHTMGVAPGDIGNYIMVPLAILMFILSLTTPSRKNKT